LKKLSKKFCKIKKNKKKFKNIHNFFFKFQKNLPPEKKISKKIQPPKSVKNVSKKSLLTYLSWQRQKACLRERE
jgi:hypothetical protein